MARLISLILVCLLIMPQQVWAASLTLEEERKLGEKALQEVLGEITLINDPDCVSYLRNLGDKMVKTLDDRRFEFKFYLAESNELNAFALPAGYIFMYRGLITKMENEGELVGVMAHEMSHVHYRHIAKRMDKSGTITAAAMAGIIAGVLLGALAGSPAVGQAVAMGSMAGAQTAALAFSREDETEADFGGYTLMTSMGYDGEDMARTFMRMWKMQRTMYATPPPYLLTHPTSPERMDAIQNMVLRHKKPVKPTDNHRFFRVRTRLIALYSNEDGALNHFMGKLRMDRRDPYALYGLALVRMRTGHYQRALRSLDPLSEIWTEDASVKRDMGICYLNLGEHEKAQTLLQEALAADPGDQQTLLSLGQSLTRQNRLDEAVFTLRRLLEKNPDLPQAHYDLGVALGKMGREAEASLQLGLSFKEQKNYKMARYHLEQAVRSLRDQPELMRQANQELKSIDEEEKRIREKKKKEQQKGS